MTLKAIHGPTSYLARTACSHLSTKKGPFVPRFFQTEIPKAEPRDYSGAFKTGLKGIATLVALSVLSGIPLDIESEAKEPIESQNNNQSRKTLSPTVSTCFNYKYALLQATYFAKDMPRAHGGKTRVYLPKGALEVVLKESGEEDSIKRFGQMERIRSILESQRSSHLIIPTAAVCGKFLVEERLPINVDRYYNMGLYIENPGLFDESVREMTRLFSKVYLSDLVSFQYHPSNNIVGDTIRYDNLPLYIEEVNGIRTGKIGLIDLEHMYEEPSAKGLATLVRIFPYHKDLIIEEATKLGISINKPNLKKRALDGKKYLQEGYIAHRDWLTKKKINSETATETFEVDANRTTAIIEVVEKELLKMNSGQCDILKEKGYLDGHIRSFLNENPAKEAKELACIIGPLFIKNITKAIREEQNRILGTHKDKASSESEIIALRSPAFRRHEVYNGVVALLKESGKNTHYDGSNIADQLFCTVAKELVKGQELFSFDPGFNSGGHEFCWIRY